MIQPLRARIREATTDAILQAAEQVFAETGIHAGRMDDIAARAGVSVGTLYTYFKDRDRLLNALLIDRKKDLVAQLDALLEQTEGQPFEATLSLAVGEMLEHFEAHRPFLSLLFQGELTGRPLRPEDPSRGSQEVLEELRQRIRQLMTRGVESGGLDPALKELYPALFLGMVRSAMFQAVLAEQPMDLALRTQQLTRFFLHGGSLTHG